MPCPGSQTVGAAGMLRAGKVAGEVRKEGLIYTYSSKFLGIYGNALSSSRDSRECYFIKINSGHPGEKKN